MKAVVIEPRADGAVLVLQEVEEPSPGPAVIKVAVRAAGVNRADLRRSIVHFAASEPSRRAAIAGLEMAGEVVAVGVDVTDIRVGERVMAMTGSAFAEYACVDARLAVRVPATLGWTEAAAIPVSFIAAHDALCNAADARSGEFIFVSGASSGAGIAAVQIARYLGARRVLGTAGNPDKLNRLRALGCDVPINYRSQQVASVVHEHTEGRGADVVIDIAGAAAAEINIDAAAIGARIVCLGRVGGARATFDLDEFARKRLRMIGVTFRTRSLAERIEAVTRFRNELLPAIASGMVKPVIDRVFPLDAAGQAQDYMRSDMHFGKIVLALEAP